MMKTVKKYLIPHEENEYKPHLFRKAGIAGVAVVAIAIFALGAFHNLILIKTDFLSAVLPRVLVDLTNNNRSSNQLAVLSPNPLLEAAAQAKANDMAAKGYFAHNSPDGKTPWYWISNSGYKFSSAGENLAVNFTDSMDVDQAWMNSPGHRANILNGKFTEIGIATAQGIYKGRPTVFVVQMFGRPSAGNVIALAPSVVEEDLLPVPSTNSDTVLGESVPPVESEETEQPAEEVLVLSETESFITTTAPEAEAAPMEAESADQASVVEELATSPKQAISLVYQILAGVVLLGLLLMIFVELRRQHPRNLVAGVLLVLFILGLMFAYQFLIGPVVVL